MNIIKESIKVSSLLVSEYSPLASFIAVNPLWDTTHNEFFSMVEKFSLQDRENDKTLLHSSNVLFSQKASDIQFQSAYEYVKEKNIKVLSMLFTQAVKKSPLNQAKSDGYKYWLDTLQTQKEDAECLLFDNRIDTLYFLLTRLDIKLETCQIYFEAIFKSLYGFASLSKWMCNHPGNPWLYFDFTLTDIIAIWLWHEWQLAKKLNVTNDCFMPQKVSNQLDLTHVHESQIRREKKYQYQLLAKLPQYKPKNSPKSKLQMIFCIDTRSELLRRHLEQLGPVQTFGYAGFFGFGFSLEKPQEKITLQCPALLTPDVIVTIEQKNTSVIDFEQRAGHAVFQTKKGVFSSLNLFELLGIWQLFAYIGKTFFPTRWAKLKAFFNKNSLQENAICVKNLSVSDATQAAWQMLTTIGLTEDFSQQVVICGHQSTSENNPYASSLDCGACGGNSGMINAMVAAKMLNHPDVRKQLQGKNIFIPADTKFIAACHCTTYDNIILHGENNELKALFERACKRVRQEKSARFPMLTQLEKRQFNWAELVPEYGLVNNAAMIIGPRWLTEEIDLEGRVFLHSYEPRHDNSGEILTSIMLAPLIVAHWINMQYYFSTALPEHFSAGNKAIHNVMPGIGVMEGNLSDLKIGLPEQSFRYRGEILHEAQRLMVIIYAEYKTIKAILCKNTKLHELVSNEWLFIYSMTDNKLTKIIL